MGARGVLRTGENGRLFFRCPGCDEPHVVRACVGAGDAAHWGFDGDYDRPTFTPSVLVTGVQMPTDEDEARVAAGEIVEPRRLVCHSFVTDGQIQFLSDCTHALAGQTVLLLPFDARSDRCSPN